MKKILFTLAAIALIGQSTQVAARVAAQGQCWAQLSYPISRSPAVSLSPPSTLHAGPAETAPVGTPTVSSFASPIVSLIVPPIFSLIVPPIDQAVIRRCCEKIKNDVQRVYFLQNRNGKMKLQIKGVYAHGPAIFFWLQLSNRSPLDYEVDSIRFLIAATGKNKAPAVALKSLQPVYVYDSAGLVPGRRRAVSIFVLPRFTLSSGQQLLINVQEKNGGRQLKVQATNWTLERARPI
jgi:hypothetical protein